VPFLKELKVQLPDVKTALTTNASLLAQYASELAEAGLHSLNVSLDTLDPQKFKKITRIGEIDSVFGGVKAAKEAGIKNIKLNTVLMKGFNDQEVPALLKYARREGFRLRLIEFMPLEDGVWSKDAFISGEEVLRTLPDGGCWRPLKIEADRDGLGPAQYYLNEKTDDVIGVITAVSNHFCSSCNRLRVSARGDLRTCLFSPAETPLRALIPEPEKLKKAILEAVKSKPKCWNDIRNGQLHMSGIGG
jgi:cyclic pyranopterin phosphate synthase